MKDNTVLRGGEPRVLVVGGDEDGLRSLCRMVRAAGFRKTIPSMDGIHAVLMAMKWQPSVAVIETSVTGMSAYEVAERLQHLPVGSPIPVVLVAWESTDGPALQANIVGAFGVLESPCEPAELASMLEEALGCAAVA